MKEQPKIIFPDVSLANGDGLLAVSRQIDTEHILAAYQSGIFPWPADNSLLLWFAPPMRGVLDFEDFKVSKRLRREFRRKGFTLAINTRFGEVMEGCARQPRPGQDGTWITPKMLKAYKELRKQGYAVSFETLDAEGNLAGGLYGLLLGRYFSGESMFHHVSGASKFALVELVDWLKGRGLSWLDTQMVTPLLASFGAREIPREEFMKRIASDCFLQAMDQA